MNKLKILAVINFCVVVFALIMVKEPVSIDMMNIPFMYLFYNETLYATAIYPGLIAMALWYPRPMGLVFLRVAVIAEFVKYLWLLLIGLFVMVLAGEHAKPSVGQGIDLALVMLVGLFLCRLTLKTDKTKEAFQQGKHDSTRNVVIAIVLLGMALLAPKWEHDIKVMALEQGWNPAVKAYQFQGGISNFAYSPDGKYLVVAFLSGKNKNISVLDAESRKTVKTFQASEEVTGVAFSPDGRYLVAGLQYEADPMDPGFEVWDMSSNEKINRFHVPADFQRKVPKARKMNEVSRLQFSPDGHYLSVINNYDVEIWDFPVGVPVKTDGGFMWLDNRHYAKRMDRAILTIGSVDTVVEESKTNILENRRWEWISGSPNGRQGAFIFTGKDGDAAEVWDIQENKKLYALTLETGEEIHVVLYSPDGKIIATGDEHGHKIKLWDAKTGLLLKTFDYPRGGYIKQLAFRQDGKRLIAASADSIAFFNIE